MSMRDSYLYPTLEAGSSRVFNLSRRTSELLRRAKSDDQAAQLDKIFKSDALNNSIVVKEARPNIKIVCRKLRHPVGTKIYFPYDLENIYDGGRSVFVDDTKINLTLEENFGMKNSENNDDFDKDIFVLNTLDNLPSLDPFLIKDKFQIERIKADDIYFDISETEWKSIRSYVSNKLKPIIEFAFQDTEELERGRTQILLDKLWNTKDIAELMPIIRAFGIPDDEASGIFSAWKGIMYYDYEYNRCLPDWKEYIHWLQCDAQAVGFVDARGRAMIESAVTVVRDDLRDYWGQLKLILAEYDDAYDLLFVKRENPEKFVAFMKAAMKKYWQLGTIISSINHCVAVWRVITSAAFNNQLKHEQLFNLLEMQRIILSKSRDTA